MRIKGLHFVDVAEIQEIITDGLKKVQKEEFSVVFQKLYDRAKACMYANGAYFEFKIKKGMCLRFKKKTVLKLLDCTVYVYSVPPCTELNSAGPSRIHLLRKLRECLYSVTGLWPYG
jgi:hypothetical protein